MTVYTPAPSRNGDTATNDGNVIQVNNVSKIYQTRRGLLPAVTDVSFGIKPGEAICLVGESGCGKTTTGKMVVGLIEPTYGEILFEGRDIHKLKGHDYDRYRRSVQIIHQDPYASLNPARTVYQTLSAPLEQYKIARGRNQLVAKVIELLERVDLTPAADFIEKYPHQLSGGQRQRLAVARALTVEPRFIVADESVSMLDVSIRMSLLETLLKLKNELGVAFIFITHDLAIARHFAWDGRIAVMYLGKIIELGPTRQVIGDPQHPYTKALLSAVPIPDPKLEMHRKRTVLSGPFPDLINPPAGCRFESRCPIAVERCRDDPPSLEQKAPGHRAACWLSE